MTAKSIQSIYPLALSQQGMLLETLGLEQPEFHLQQSVCRIRPQLDIELFRRSWQRVVDRHSTLRTCFVWNGVREPVQVVLPRVEIPLTFEDWRTCSADEQSDRLEQYLKIDGGRGFDLRRAPLMRFALMRLDEQTYQLVLTFHHIVCDGWSLSLVLDEVLTHYLACTIGQAPPSVPPPSFLEYVRWQRAQDVSYAQTYWTQRLSGFRQPTALGRTESVPAEAAGQGAFGEKKIRLGQTLSDSLCGLAREHLVTLNTVFQGAWALVLSSYGNDSDIVFGTTVSGRPSALPGSLQMVGLFINTIPLRVRIRSEVSLWEWLLQIQVESAADRAYEHCSSGQIHGWSEVGANHPLYESVLVFENYPEGLMRSGALPLAIDLVQKRELGARTSCPLALIAALRGDLYIRAIHQPSRVNDEACLQILEHLRLVLTAIVESPQKSVSALIETIPRSTIPIVAAAPQRRTASSALFAWARDSVELRCVGIWEEVLARRPVGIHDNFFALGGHSLLALNLMNAMEREFGKSLPLSTLLECPTVAGVAGALRASSNEMPAPLLVPIRASGSVEPFFCVPGGATDVISLQPLASALGSDIPFYGLQPHGLDGLREPLRTVREMAASYTQEIRGVQPRGPYFIGGHSFGAYVAYEITQQLRAQGHEVALLAILDASRRSAPQRKSTADSRADQLRRLLNLLRRFFGTRVDITAEEMAGLDEAGAVPRVAAKLAAAQVLPAAMSTQRLEAYVRVAEASAAAFDSYGAEGDHPIPIALFRASEANDEDAVSSWFAGQDAALGWGALTVGEPSVSWVPGDHVTMITQPNVATLGERLHSILVERRTER
jgi:thioesterase domain-containing protein